MPLQHIKTFKAFCEICIFPFIQFSNKDGTRVAEISSQSQENSKRESENSRQFAIWGRSPGLFKNPVVVNFLGANCNVGLHYIKEKSFRISINPLDSKRNNQLFVELVFDQTAFESYFKLLE